jgi:catechol 2,3-dioxygenase-like lactoylglutathione lyase family enzyme
MIDHLSVGITQLARSIHFYRGLFAPLGYALQHENAQEAAFGPGSDRTFWLYPSPGSTPMPGMHIAFAAKDARAVDDAFAAAAAGGATIAREPAARPEISDTYYGCIVLDPDGHRLEIVSAAGAARSI